MKLNGNNFSKWKAELDRLMLEQYKVEAFSSTRNEREWLADYRGQTVQDAINDEVSAWENDEGESEPHQ